jgi:hypothetical protein
MERDPLAARDAHRAQLAACAVGVVAPDAGLAGLAAGGGDAEPHAGVDDGVLEVAQELVEVALAVAEQEDGVRDDLAGAVIGDVAAPLDLDHLDIAGHEDVLRGLAATAEREHVRMLDDEERVGDGPYLALLDEPDLLGPDVAVGRGAEIEDLPLHEGPIPRKCDLSRNRKASDASNERALVRR